MLCVQPVWSQVGSRQQEALQWLQRVAMATQNLSYSGTFVYRNGSQSETSRIVHFSSEGRQKEKLEVLDGSPREVIRENDEVKCYLPESRLMIVEQRSARRTFPALPPGSLAGLGEHYSVRKGGTARVAGYDSQIVRLEPRDPWRYGHQFWVERETGLLLKAEMFDARGEVLESLAFTELRLGQPPSPDALKSRHADAVGNAWQIRLGRARDLRDPGPWLFRTDLPGFRRQAAMQRSISGGDGSDERVALHWVYSDGLAAMSVFISPLRGGESGVDGTVQASGAMSVIKRVVDGHLVVVMGDVPPASVMHFAEGIGVKGK
jgi:sigma-E factor negative regulatory protein RseB